MLFAVSVPMTAGMPCRLGTPADVGTGTRWSSSNSTPVRVGTLLVQSVIFLGLYFRVGSIGAASVGSAQRRGSSLLPRPV